MRRDCNSLAPAPCALMCCEQIGHMGPHRNGNNVWYANKMRPLQPEVEDAVRTLLEHIGENPFREGLLDTPKRVAKALLEMNVGYTQNPTNILARDFEMQGYDEMIAVPNIEFYSTCEHHMLPFFGVAHVAYIPGGKKLRVVGLSKLARVVDCFARRLQVQERMTSQIADAIEDCLDTKGVAVVIHARHFCMCGRGVQKHKSSMVTSSMRGVFKKQTGTRAEFFALVNTKGNGL